MLTHSNTALMKAQQDLFTDKYYGAGMEKEKVSTAVSASAPLPNKLLFSSGALFIAIGKTLQKHGRISPRRPQLAK